MIPYGRHVIGQDDIDAVVDVLQHQFLTQGQQVPRFEQALNHYCASQYCVAVNSGTSALHIACLALGVTKGDHVWTSPLSFVASANCALYCGASIDFVDIEAVSRNLCPQKLADKLAQASIIPKAVIVVHYAGISCDMQAIKQLSVQYGFAIIEDASHALGGTYQGRPIGSCQYSDMTVLSFHPVKSITTAEGGAVTTNNAELHQRLVLFAKHGITRDPELMENPSPGNWYYEQIELGFNYRLSDLHAVLGISQLAKLDEFVSKRQQRVNRYNHKLNDLPVILPTQSEASQSAWHLYSIELRKHDRSAVYQQLQQQGVGVNVHYIPIHLQPYYQRLGFKAGDFPVAEHFYKNALTLPLFPTLSVDDQDRVINTLITILS
ncbi:UDP-4-amino-4,6-dideoxy-N-acetyl-beta-L-altrosamine transaminase [Neptunicella sp.]|uniref:UDP-4-amino-4, 6-dideoxy-N-acetyl-beta-L-altrosamine transaminase n=1 Tax=Neptunicella sp. TaxID=2125986 RepID=UPI003F68D388